MRVCTRVNNAGSVLGFLGCLVREKGPSAAQLSFFAIRVRVSGTWATNCITGCSSMRPGCGLLDRAALIDVYATTGGVVGNWTSAGSAGWLSNTSPCAGWDGVYCNGGSTAVTYV